MKRLLPLPFLSAALLVSGCISLEPHYQRPASPTPASFPSGGAYPTLTDPQTVQPPSWRATFTDPKLQGLIETALTQNRSLRATVASVAAARAQYQLQRAEQFPTVNGQATAVYSREPLSTLAGATGTTGGTGTGAAAAAANSAKAIDVHAWTAGVGVTNYELDLFGKARSLTHEAFEQYLATDEGRRSAQLSLIAEVANDYLNLAADRTSLQVAQQTLNSGQQTVNLIQARFEHGVANGLDLSQAQTIVEQARADVARYTAAAARDKNALDLSVGQTVDEARTPANLNEAMGGLADVPAGLSSAILLSRPDVLQAEHTLKAANADIGAARAAFFPSLNLTGSAGVASTSLGGLFSHGLGVWSFTPALTVPIFDAGKNAANLKVSKAQKDEAIAQYEYAIQSAFRDVANGLADRAGTANQLQATQALVNANATALTLANARYERGADTYLNTLDAQRQLYAAQQSLVAIQLARGENVVTLYKSLGGT